MENYEGEQNEMKGHEDMPHGKEQKGHGDGMQSMREVSHQQMSDECNAKKNSHC